MVTIRNESTKFTAFPLFRLSHRHPADDAAVLEEPERRRARAWDTSRDRIAGIMVGRLCPDASIDVAR
jgi:hypothetical protein